jgi:CheY-like chemotaxis protein
MLIKITKEQAPLIGAKLNPGSYVCLTIADTGTGMPPEVLAKVFEPFFTTKPLGEGTGLGLSVVHGIMESHEGAITVDSTPNVGTTFTLYFPVVNARAAESKHELPLYRGSGERVLVVDDEEMLVKLAGTMLTHLGYMVEGFTSPELALERFRQAPGEFAAVLTDLTMPKLTGSFLARLVRRIEPSIPIILSSGYVQTPEAEQICAEGGIEFMPKPFDLVTLSTRLHAIFHPAQGAN